MNKMFKKIVRIQESSKINKGFWTTSNVFIYSTLNHIKYLLPNGDVGILKSICQIHFPIALVDATLYSFDINHQLVKTKIENMECTFKMALSKNDIVGVKSFVKNKKIVGSSMISYLQKKNYPSVALSLTEDMRSKFQLALKSGNLQSAYESAILINDTECYNKLSQEALLQGWYPLVETGYQASKNNQKLSFLHLVTGNLPGLETLKEQAIKDKDLSAQFNISIYQGDVESRIKALVDMGQFALAYQSAVNHGLTEISEAIKKSVPTNIKYTKKSSAFCTPKPIIQNFDESNEMMNGWPVFDISEEKQAFANIESDQEDEKDDIGVDNLEDVGTKQNEEKELDLDDIGDIDVDKKAGDKWDDSLDVDMSDDDDEEVQDTQKKPQGPTNMFVARENPIRSHIKKSSNIPSELLSVGLFKEALQKLELQLGIKNKSLIVKQFYEIYLASEFYFSTTGFTPVHPQHMTSAAGPNEPLIPINLKFLEKKLKLGYSKTTEGGFEEALDQFREILVSIPLLCLNSKADLSSTEKFIQI